MTKQTQNKLTNLQNALIEAGIDNFIFTSHKIEKSVNVADVSDNMILMLLKYGIQRKGNDDINGQLKDLRDKDKNIDEAETVKDLLEKFVNKILTGDFTNKASQLESETKKQVQLWLVAKGFANSKSFGKETGTNKMTALQLLSAFTPKATEEETARRIKALTEKAQNIINMKNVDDIL